MATLDEIRKKLQALEDQKAGNKSFGTSLVYPFWNIAENDTVSIRFLPDANEDNPLFWKELQTIYLEFPGVKGGDENKKVTVRVPCIEMWGETCPIHAELRPWFKDPSLEETARKYWKKRSYVFQGFVIDNPIAEDAEKAPTNPIRRINLGRQLFNIVKNALMDQDMENNPVDFLTGTNFRITRTKKGSYNDYTASSWARKETALTEEQLEAIETHGLFNLEDWVPKKPTPEGLNAMFEMFEASLEGDLYDPERWAAHYRPWGLEYEGTGKSDNNTDSDKTAESKVDLAAKVGSTKEESKVEIVKEEEEKETVTETPKASSGTSAQDILAKIRSRAQ